MVQSSAQYEYFLLHFCLSSSTTEKGNVAKLLGISGVYTHNLLTFT